MNNTVEVVDIDNEIWIDFVRRHERAAIFHSPAWAKMLAHCYKRKAFVIGGFDKYGNMTAGIPVIENSSILGEKRWISLPYTDQCEPLFVDHAQKAEFYGNIGILLQQDQNTRCEFRWLYPEVPFLHPRREYYHHALSLSSDFDETALKIHPMHKRNAQTARKRNLTIITRTDKESLKEFYKLHLITRQRKGVPIQPWHFFRHFGEDLLQNNMGFIMLAYQDNICLAAAIFLLWNKTMTYKFGASSLDYLQQKPNDLIFWNAIRWGCENGYSTLDFGRTDIDNKGLRDYKSRWGAVESELYYSYAPTVTQPRPAWAMNIMSQTIKHSPLWVCRLSGELLYRFAN